MKFLVTGGSGFIGSSVVDMLLQEGYEVLNIDTKPPNIPSHGTHWWKCNILNRPELKSAFQSFGPTHVIHLAAKTDTLSNSIDDYKCNTLGTENVLAAIQSTESVDRLIITSTQYVNQSDGAPKNDEDYAPHTVYGESKVICEKATRAADLKCVWTIIRPTNIWGPWHPRYPTEFWHVLGRGLYFHPSGPQVIRSYGYVKNVSFQIMKICEARPETVREKVFYVGDMPVDVLVWANRFSLLQTGKDVKVVPRILIRFLAFFGDMLARWEIPFPITSSRYNSMTTSNSAPMAPIFKEFGSPPYTMEEGIRETVEWLKIHHPEIVTIR